jgi:methylenetetrahydrofolate--tRNA-(uracil-5-)-methyltransferase
LSDVTIIGAGLAGSEAAFQLANHGIKVTLYEMRPKANTPAHKTSNFAELICSNSLKSLDETTASGLLKQELGLLGSVLLKTAMDNSIPSGHALVVNRNSFADSITMQVLAHPNITFINEPISKLPEDSPVIITTGPLTLNELTSDLATKVGTESLYFYDAIAPVIDGSTIDTSKVYSASRYDKGTPLLNCPIEKDEYLQFYHELINAEQVKPHEFEDSKYFEACMPIEELAKRGVNTLRFGPFRPVGLDYPDEREFTRPYAVVQLRPEDSEGHAYNLVGCQTRMTYPEQKRVFRLIPALRNVEFFQLGSIHRNTYLNAPQVFANHFLELKTANDVYVAGQLGGTEGYVEAIATGLWVGLTLALKLHGKEISPPPKSTVLGALLEALLDSTKKFQPVKANFGLMPIAQAQGKKLRRIISAEIAKNDFEEWLKSVIL